MKKPHTKKSTRNVVIPSSIPSVLLSKVNDAGLTRIMSQHLLTLLYLVYQELDEDEDEYYKLLSQTYLLKVTSKDFVTDVFPQFRYNYKHVASNKISEEESIFQTRGLASHHRGIANYYRINPQLLNDDFCLIQIEIPEEEISLNHLFPEIINHFHFCTKHFTFDKTSFYSRLDQELMIIPSFVDSPEYSDVVIISRNINEFRVLKKNKFESFFSEKVYVLGKWTEMKVGFKKLKELKEKLQKEHPDKELWIIIDRHKYYIDDLYTYMDRRQKRAIRFINDKVHNLTKGLYAPTISKSNGRFNHTLSNLNSFALKYLRINGGPTITKDLTASQFTILVNLMAGSPIFKQSLYASNFPFKEELNVFFNAGICEHELQELKQKLKDPNFDVYQVIADKTNVHRVIAKNKMFTLLFNERPPRDKELTTKLPEFFANLEKVREAFRNAFGNSKEMLPVFLQMVEAHIFVENIYQRMANEGIVGFTRHDSITIGDNPKDKDKLDKILQDVFFEIDFYGSFKIDHPIPYETTIKRNDLYSSFMVFGSNPY
jgi:hypothetical protein